MRQLKMNKLLARVWYVLLDKVCHPFFELHKFSFDLWYFLPLAYLLEVVNKIDARQSADGHCVRGEEVQPRV